MKLRSGCWLALQSSCEGLTGVGGSSSPWFSHLAVGRRCSLATWTSPRGHLSVLTNVVSDSSRVSDPRQSDWSCNAFYDQLSKSTSWLSESSLPAPAAVAHAINDHLHLKQNRIPRCWRSDFARQPRFASLLGTEPGASCQFSDSCMNYGEMLSRQQSKGPDGHWFRLSSWVQGGFLGASSGLVQPSTL